MVKCRLTFRYTLKRTPMLYLHFWVQNLIFQGCIKLVSKILILNNQDFEYIYICLLFFSPHVICLTSFQEVQTCRAQWITERLVVYEFFGLCRRLVSEKTREQLGIREWFGLHTLSHTVDRKKSPTTTWDVKNSINKYKLPINGILYLLDP